MSMLTHLLSGGTSEDTKMVAPALKAALAKRDEARQEKMGTALLMAAQSVDSHLEAEVTNLRRIRKQEVEIKKRLDKMNHAKLYFEQTGNPVPFYTLVNSLLLRQFLSAVGIESSDLEDEDKEVPADWKPAA